MLSSKQHGALDYLVGALMIAAPWLFGFARGGAETHIFVALGLAALVYSLATDYELGAVRIIPFSIHKLFDLASGILLLMSPWLFGFVNQIRLPHVIFGVFEIVAVMMTRGSLPVRSKTP
jgi:hypothetical protein